VKLTNKEKGSIFEGAPKQRQKVCLTKQL